MRWSERLYRSLLRLYPREFRDEYGDEMSLLFRDRASEGSGRLWLQIPEICCFTRRRSIGAR